jgi:hypothetical protein
MIVLFITALTGQLMNNELFRQLVIQLIIGFLISNPVFVLCKSNVKWRRPYANAQLQQDLNMEIQNRDPGHGSKQLESFPSGHVLWTTICVSLIGFQSGYVSALFLGG